MSRLKLSGQMSQLISDGRVALDCHGFAIDAQIDRGAQMLYLVTTAFDGGNYIPDSVRRVLPAGQVASAFGDTAISLIVDDPRSRILLVVKAPFDETDIRSFEDVVTEFVELANEWHYILEDHGQQDLVYITASR